MNKRNKQLVLTALFFAMAVILALVEAMLPGIPGVPGVKLGLSNVPAMYALFFMGGIPAYTIALLKGCFVALTRGGVAGLLSVSGGIFSITVMLTLTTIFKKKISYLIVSVVGAIFHNIGQLVAISLVYTSIYTVIYLPVLILLGIIAGASTSFLLRLILPHFDRLGLK